MEMWNGWFDAWGDGFHHTTSAEDYAKVVDDMLTKGSLNMYMLIGGTNFGFTSGANHYEKFTPDVTSYDYDAPLTECGDITPKYMALREVIKKHTGKDFVIETSSGKGFPDDLSPYSLVIHCGGCMLNEREVQYRRKFAEDSGVPFTNYGTAIAHMHGILKRSVEFMAESPCGQIELIVT
jgi:hypothetical protein